MEPHRQSPWSPILRPCSSIHQLHDGTFFYGQRQLSPAVGMKVDVEIFGLPMVSDLIREKLQLSMPGNIVN